MSAGLQIALTGGADAARAARWAVAEHHPALPQPGRSDLALLVTELVANAVRDGGAAEDRPLQLECRNRHGRIRVEVIDPGKGTGNGGWGLFLLDRIAESWGIRDAPAGTCVWFEMPLGATR